MSEGGGGSAVKGVRTGRSSGPVYNPDLDFPPSPKFQPADKLPTIKSVVCQVRYHMGVSGKGGVKGITEKMAIRETAKQVSCKWYSDTVCCLPLRTIERRLEVIYKIFSEGKKRLQEKGKENSPAAVKYRELSDNKDDLFDVYLNDPVARLNLQEVIFD